MTSQSSHSSSNNKKRILFVDDEPDMTSLFKMALEDVGFNIDIFNDPSLALENFQPNLYDFIILDIVMPKMGGFELYKQLKKVDPGVKVCFLTASVMYDEKLRKEEYCDLDKVLFIQNSE